MSNNIESRKFSAHTDKVLKMMISAVYTNKDVCWREIIANALDAIEKRRHLALSDDSLAAENGEYLVSIKIDDKLGTISVSDNGIGMTREELTLNLGTIARSGTEEFVEQASKNNALIGQFGVGFYSSFMLADKVDVTSKKVGSDEGSVWSSDGETGFTVSRCYDVCKSGTTIVLHMKKDEKEYMDRFRLKHIIESYFKYVNTPISIEHDGDIEEIKTTTPIWALDKKCVTEAEYNALYKSLSHLPDKPSLTIHYNPEGLIDFKSVLFIPSIAPLGLFHPNRDTRIKLYVKNVFITENIDLIPKFFRFVYGIVECNDLPLNVSREALQSNSILNKVGDLIVKKIISDITKMRTKKKDEYLSFWNHFGNVWKEGLCESTTFRSSMLENTLFYTTQSPNVPISLDEYIARIPDGQKDIYYCCSDSVDSAMSNPQLESFLKNNIEVLLLVDSVDGFWLTVVHEYNKMSLKSVSSVGTKLDFVDENLSDDFKDINKDEIATLFKNALSGRVKDVVISNKLTSSPLCISVPNGAMDINMERFLVEQKQLKKASLKILEINPCHTMVQIAVSNLRNSSTYQKGVDLVTVMFEIACISQGEPLENDGLFGKRANQVLTDALFGLFNKNDVVDDVVNDCIDIAPDSTGENVH